MNSTIDIRLKANEIADRSIERILSGLLLGSISSMFDAPEDNSYYEDLQDEVDDIGFEEPTDSWSSFSDPFQGVHIHRIKARREERKQLRQQIKNERRKKR